MIANGGFHKLIELLPKKALILLFVELFRPLSALFVYSEEDVRPYTKLR